MQQTGAVIITPGSDPPLHTHLHVFNVSQPHFTGTQDLCYKELISSEINVPFALFEVFHR